MNGNNMSMQGVSGEFTDGQIRVECPYPIQMVHELEIIRKLNQHGKVQIKGILWEQDGEKCIHQVKSEDSIVIYAENAYEKRLLFSGVVTDVDIFYRDCIYYIEITGLSWSSLLDYEEIKRSFQDKEMSYSALINQVLCSYPGSKFLTALSFVEKPINQFLLQYRETDWAFLKRIATHFQTQLVADVTGKTPGFWFGLPENMETIKSIGEVVVKRNVESYHQALAGGFIVQEDQFVKYQIRSKEQIELGNRVEYEGQRMVIEESQIMLKEGLLQYTYILSMEAALCMEKQMNTYIQGVSLLGKILESENQRVKVQLKIDEKQEMKKACWFPYASQANNLFYCMPEIGTEVSLYFSNSDETSGIVMNAVRKNGGSCSKTSNPELKYMGTPEGKELKLGTTDIKFTAHEELLMATDAESGTILKSPKDLNIFTKQQLYLEAKELVRIFTETGNIAVGAKEESGLYLLNGADGDAHIKAGNNLIYAGRRKEVFTERLNQEIAYEEKKFEWDKLLTNVLIGLAVVAVVALAISTGGAGLVAASVLAKATAGAVICGSFAVGAMAVSDIMRGEVSDLDDYVLAGFKGAIEGAISGAVLGLSAFEKAKLLTKMFVSGGVSFIADAIGQGADILFRGGSYNWKQGLFSFGIGFLMPAVEVGINKAKKIIDKFGKKMLGWLDDVFCKLGGDPVDLVSGNVLYDTIDFELPGPIPLQWRRIWCSASQIMGHLGHGTRYNYEMGLEVLEEEFAITVFLGDGRVGVFPYLLVGEETYSYENKVLLRRKADHYQLFDPESRYSYFLYPIEKGYLSYKLTKICNPQGHQIQFFYDEDGYLSQILDSVGRKLEVTTNGLGRIIQVSLREDGYGEKSHALVCYGYNQEQDLELIRDAVGVGTYLSYRNHLLIKKTDRNNHSFYWEYDKYEDGARALRTWGDEDVLSLWIDYHDEEGYNSVRRDKKGLPKEYHYNENMLCTRIIHEDLTETRESYNDYYQLVSQIDEEGRLTKYQYNDWSQITAIIMADASKMMFSYDENGRLIEATNPGGESRKWSYNKDDTLEKMTDEAGLETFYFYNALGLVEKIAYANQGEVCLEYDKHLNLSKVILADGSTSSWEYDGRGNCVTAINPLGAVETYQYDKLNRMVKARLADGNEVRLTYDGYQSILHAKDKQTEVNFTYTILGSLASRAQGNRKLAYTYDKQEELISVTNEKGECYRFERDVKGNVIKEVGYDSLTRTYERDYSGLVTRINRPGERFTKYAYDKLGRVIRTDYYDGSFETFTYDKNGMLTGAENQDTKIGLERDVLGRVVREWQDEYWIESQYDEMGNRIQTTSSLGANILTKRDRLGQTVQLTAYMDQENPWEAIVEYNQLGQETGRLVSGGVYSNWEYDSIGRPIFHGVNIQGKEIRRQGNASGRSIGHSEAKRRRRYEWDVNCRLKKVANELTKGSTEYTYDQFSNLVSAKETGFSTLFRMTDMVGNLYETGDNSDRIYGKGSRLEQSGIDLKEKRNTYQGGHGRLVTKGNHFVYDEEGNLEKKTEANGDTWCYGYYGNGMLKEVIRPDRSIVRFRYDALGRRTEKSVIKPYDNEITCKSQEKVVRFLWDQNTPFHEWEETREGENKTKIRTDYQAEYIRKLKNRETEKNRQKEEKKIPDNLITWVFQDDFIPRGKLTKTGNYSIISDYLGTPVEAYDGEGEKVWESELDIYGRVKSLEKSSAGSAVPKTGEQCFIPFRFQGQYEDEETGLYYNRFRYYDPSLGQYTQQDPIGLAGGNPTLYGYVFNPLYELDPFGLDVRTGIGRTHVTYRGFKGGLPYTGYASAPSELGLTADQIVYRRYGGNFKDFGGQAPTVIYTGKDKIGKWTARGLEQRFYEFDVKRVGKDFVANAQNPVGENNPNRTEYLEAADNHLKKNPKIYCNP